MAMDIRNQFKKELLRSNLNVAEQDGKPCVRCGIIPKVTTTEKDGKVLINRSSRVDCDIGDKKEQLETYCEDCWNIVGHIKTKKVALDKL